MHEIDFLRVVSDEQELCSYLPQQTSRLPLQVPLGDLSAQQFDRLLEAGYRRSGWFFYRTQCPNCRACEPLRLEVNCFQPSRSQRRAQKRGAEHLRIEIAAPAVDTRRVELFNRHRVERGLSREGGVVGEHDYRSFLINSYTEVSELSLWVEDKLIGVSITDVGLTSLSAVYCFFDPDYEWLNPGTYAILQQIRLAQALGFRWLYLGLMVSANSHLQYKANYRPHQRLINGSWELFT